MQILRPAHRRFCQFRNIRSTFPHLFTGESRLHESWQHELSKVVRPSAATLIAKLTPQNSLGFPGALENAPNQRTARDQSKLRVVDLATMWKDMHPEMVLLVRMGDFYEAWGVDAVMLIEHAGLNPMGDSLRAGCPKGNIQQTLNSLTDAGLSVAVFEEANVVGSRSKKLRKERYLSQVVTPGRPIYLHDSCLREGELPYRASKPYGAIRCTRAGCSLALIWVDAKEVRVTDSLTEEAIGSLIDGAGGIAEPVWMSIEPGAAGNRLARLKNLLPSRSHKLPIRLSQESFLSAVLEDISRHLSLGTGSDFLILKESIGSDPNRLQPLHASAAQFLGLSSGHPPDLVKSMLPSSAPFHCHYFLRNWLLCPPPRDLTDAMRRVVQQVSELTCVFPKYRVVPVDKLVRPLETRNGNFLFFSDIYESCRSFQDTPDALLYSKDLIDIAKHMCGLSGRESVETLLGDAKNIQKHIAAALYIEGPPEDVSQVRVEALGKFFRSKECEFISTVRGDFAALSIARNRLVDAVNRSLVSPDKSLRYDQISDKLYVKDVDVSLRGEARKKPIPDDGSRKRQTTDLILKAESDYRSAAEDAKNISKSILQDLCRDLSETRFKQSLIFFSHWAVITSTVIAHVENSLRRGWTIPQLSSFGATEIRSAWPFWLNPLPHGPAVENNCDLSEGAVSILTAPNMSGKSTLIRSIGAIALLANCGMMVPAKSVKAQKLTNLLVVSPNGDRPVEGLSAFAAEAEAMAVAIRESTAKSHKSNSTLLLIDEFGRGTSGKDASALSGAVIEWLAKQNHVACIWATHLHELFDMAELEMSRWIQMEGYKLLDGKCNDSKGIETALDRGFPVDIVRKAFSIRNGSGEVMIGGTETETCPVKKAHSRLFPHLENSQIVELDQGFAPPPSLQSSSLVYVLRFPGKKYYIGETEDFNQRIKAHKQRFRSHPEKIWLIKREDKSQARALETSLIQAFLDEGVSLLSTVDGSHRFSSSVIR